jgi:hypothetical protein
MAFSVTIGFIFVLPCIIFSGNESEVITLRNLV